MADKTLSGTAHFQAGSYDRDDALIYEGQGQCGKSCWYACCLEFLQLLYMDLRGSTGEKSLHTLQSSGLPTIEQN